MGFLDDLEEPAFGLTKPFVGGVPPGNRTRDTLLKRQEHTASQTRSVKGIERRVKSGLLTFYYQMV